MRRGLGLCAWLAAVAVALGCGTAFAGPAEDCNSPSSLVRIKGCSALIRAHPRDAEAYYRRGEAYRRVGTYDAPVNYDLAIADFSAAIRLRPDRVDAFFGRAEAYFGKKDYDRAIADYDQVLRRAPDVGDYFYRRGVARFAKGDDAGAIADMRETIRLDPTIDYSLHLSGDAHRRQGDYAAAIADYTEEFRRTPPTGQQRKDRAIAYLLAGQYDLAIDDFNAVARDNVFFVAIGRFGRGVARLRQGDTAGGNADIAEALDRDSGMAEKFARDGVTPVAAVAPAAAPAEPAPLAAERERALKPCDAFHECENCPEMVVVPAGSFLMGSPDAEPGREAREGPQHRVTIARAFAVARFPLTAAEWKACAAERGCRDDADDGWGDRSPVTGPSWNDAQSYVTWLSKRTGKTYRLLSEAEYEYAARAGTQTAYPWGEAIGSRNAVCHGCGSRWDDKSPAPVGSFAANGFGLYDMVGSVQSFVEDCDHDSYAGAPADGAAWTGGDCRTRVVRGGSWARNAEELRSASRGSNGMIDRYPDVGFRVARTLDR